MAVEAMRAVWDHAAAGSTGERLVLLALAYRADTHGLCWPSVAELAERTRLSRRAVQYALKALRTRGELIVVDERTGRGRTPLYRISLPGLDGELDDLTMRRRQKGAKGAIPRALSDPLERVQRVQSTTQKGAIHDTPYVEEPLGTVRNTEEQAPPSVPDPEPPPFLPSLPATLNRVVEGKRARALNLRAAIKACHDFADRGHAEELDKFAHYWLDGSGQNRRLRDVAGAWRNWLRSAPKAGAARSGKAARVDAQVRDLLKRSETITSTAEEIIP